MNGCKDFNKFSHQSKLLAIHLDHTAATLLDYNILLTIKTVELHVYRWMDCNQLLSRSLDWWLNLYMNGCKDFNKFSYQSRLLAIHLDHAATTLLDCNQLLTIKTVELHVLVFIKVVNLDLSFYLPLESANFDFCTKPPIQLLSKI